jgi:hypothetical protein
MNRNAITIHVVRQFRMNRFNGAERNCLHDGFGVVMVNRAGIKTSSPHRSLTTADPVFGSAAACTGPARMR